MTNRERLLSLGDQNDKEDYEGADFRYNRQ